MVNVLQAMILTDGPKMLLTPTYHVYRMYVPFQDATLVPVAFDPRRYLFSDIALPQVDAVAARDKSGRLWLALVNVDPNQPVWVTAAFDSLKAQSAKGEVLTAPAVDAHNSFAKPDEVAPRPFAGRQSSGGLRFNLPPKSVAVVEVR
jgi:alpha-N-arabinofuranosidase